MGVAATFALSACASSPELLGVAPAGHQSDGRYILSASEQGLGCRQMRGEVERRIARLHSLPTVAAEERAQLPLTITAAWRRASGSSATAADDEMARIRIEIASLNETLGQRGCGTIDVEQRLKTIGLETASVPAKPAAANGPP